MELMRAMEEAHERAEHDALAAFETAREEIKNRDGEEYNALKFSLEAAVEALEKHFEEAHRAYVGSTDTRAESFKRLTRQDATSAKTIERRMRRLIRLREQLAAWRVKAETNRREWEARNSALRREKERVSAHYHALAESMRTFRAEARRKLSALIADATSAGWRWMKKSPRRSGCSHSDGSREDSRRRRSASRRSISTEGSPRPSARRRRRKSARWRRRPRAGQSGGGGDAPVGRSGGGATRTSDAEAEKRKRTGEARDGDERPLASAEGTHEHGEGSLSSWGADASGAPVPEHEYLERFFNRRNRAFLSERAIDRERRRLDRENEDLRAILKQYLDGVSVNEDVIGDPANPLFVVNDKVLRRRAERRAAAERGGNRGKRRGAGRTTERGGSVRARQLRLKMGFEGEAYAETDETDETDAYGGRRDSSFLRRYEGTWTKQPKATERLQKVPKEYRLGIQKSTVSEYLGAPRALLRARLLSSVPYTLPYLPAVPSMSARHLKNPDFDAGALSLDDAFPSRGALDPRLDEGRRLERHRLFAPGVFRLDDRQPALARASRSVSSTSANTISRARTETGMGVALNVAAAAASAPPRSREVRVQATRLQVRTPIGRDEFKKSGAVSGVVFAARVEREGHLARRQRVARGRAA